MSYEATVLYENSPDAKFDMDYYIKSHMPYVQKEFGRYGLKGWRVLQFDHQLGESSPKFNVQATLLWDTKEGMEQALNGPEAKGVFGDVPNFSSTGPMLISGTVQKSEAGVGNLHT